LKKGQARRAARRRFFQIQASSIELLEGWAGNPNPSKTGKDWVPQEQTRRKRLCHPPVAAFESERHRERGDRKAGPKGGAEHMAESPTLETREDGAPNPKPWKTLRPRKNRYCTVNVNGVIMPRNGINASNGNYGEGERVCHPPNTSVPGYPSENAYGASVMRVQEPFSP
jgi:hypothetical protein